MTSKVFNVSDYYDLLALHRALLESKFCDEPNDMDVSASPIIAKLHKQLLKVLIEIEVEKKGEDSRVSWAEWLKIDSERREWQQALKRARHESLWQEWDVNTKKNYIYNLLSPFHLDDVQVCDFIVQVDGSL